MRFSSADCCAARVRVRPTASTDCARTRAGADICAEREATAFQSERCAQRPADSMCSRQQQARGGGQASSARRVQARVALAVGAARGGCCACAVLPGGERPREFVARRPSQTGRVARALAKACAVLGGMAVGAGGQRLRGGAH